MGMSERERILIVAGEVSGDIHAGNLLRELRQLIPDIEAFGVGGGRLADAGLEALFHSNELAHMGLVEVVRELPRLRRLMRSLSAEAARRRPHVAVLVDSPDFNLRLARRLKRLGIPVVLYVSPQLWAWRSGRVRVVRQVAREVLCILPFETGFYEENGVKARFVGHPLVDDLDRAGFLNAGKEPKERRLALLPGSRASEVRHLLPIMLRALKLVPRELFEDVPVIAAPGVQGEIDAAMGAHGHDERLRIMTGEERRLALSQARLAWTASGTATLECALLDVPMIVGYKLQALSYRIARRLVHVPHIALVNLIAEERAVPELIQDDFNEEKLAAATREALDGGIARQEELLERVRERLGPPGASARAAAAVAAYLTPAQHSGMEA